MMKKTLSLFLLVFFFLETSNAQVSDYDKTAAEIKADVWGSKDADFENNSVPDQYKNESAIILAKRYDIEAKIKKHFRLSMAIGLWLFMGKADRRSEYVYRRPRL
jgi:hypothetical protein